MDPAAGELAGVREWFDGTATDGRWNTTRYTYDGRGNRISVVSPPRRGRLSLATWMGPGFRHELGTGLRWRWVATR